MRSNRSRSLRRRTEKWKRNRLGQRQRYLCKDLQVICAVHEGCILQLLRQFLEEVFDDDHVKRADQSGKDQCPIGIVQTVGCVYQVAGDSYHRRTAW